MVINLALCALVFGCTKILASPCKNKFSFEQINNIFAKRNYCSKESLFTVVEQTPLEEALNEVADLVEGEDKPLEKLMEIEISNGYNFFLFLFSSKNSGPGSSFRRIFDKCFPDKIIPDQIFEKVTVLEKYNLLHLCIWEENLDVALEILLNNENSRILDRGDLVGNTPLFSLFGNCINFNLQEKCDYVQLTRVVAVFDQMLFRGFDVKRRNEDRMNFLGNMINSLNHLSIDEEKMKVGVNYIEMIAKVISSIANSPSAKPYWLPVRKALAEYEEGRKVKLKAEYESRIAEATSGKTSPEEKQDLAAKEIEEALAMLRLLNQAFTRIERDSEEMTSLVAQLMYKVEKLMSALGIKVEKSSSTIDRSKDVVTPEVRESVV